MESEVRRLHIIYFLSRTGGRTEQPHLVRVHHLTRTGVYLRDVKRWLGELRGKDMPQAYAWSYKRRYKSGYVWQDLVDDDLITPLSDNEYVLKGSEIVFSPFRDEKTDIEKPIGDSLKICSENQRKLQTQDSRIFSDINEESSSFGSGRSSLSDELEQNSSVVIDKKFKKQDEEGPPKVKGFSGGASTLLRNFITCGAIDTNDNVFVTLRRRRDNDREALRGPGFRTSFSDQQEEDNHKPQRQSRTITRERHSEQKKESEMSKQRPSINIAAYRPVGMPNCSQCGKSFKPAKLHSHMKSCTATKASISDSSHRKSSNYIYKESALGYFLTN